MERELGTRLPEEVRVVALEESADTIYLVLPGAPMAGREGLELSDQELESVAGGGTWGADTCQATCGDCTHTVLETSSAHLADKAAAYPRIQGSR